MSSFQISKARLKQIIREEQEKLDAEGFGGHQEDIQELASFESVDVGDFVTVVGGVLAGSTDGESDEATVGKVMSTGPDSVEIRLTNVSSSGQKYKQKGDMATVKMDHISPSQGAYDRAYGNRNDEAKQKSTKKYDDNPNLKGDQDELPDSLQKAIIKKAGGDAEEEDEEKNESLDLETMIRQEILAALNGA